MGHVGLIVWQARAGECAPGLGRRIPSFALEPLEGRYFFSVQLDAGFGQGGHAYGPAPAEFGPRVDPYLPYQTLAVQADGSILVAGDFDTGRMDHPRMTVVRFRPDGALDPTFDAGPLRDDFPPYLLPQPDGSVVLVRNESLERLRPDGNPDPTYAFEPPSSLEDLHDANDPLFWELENPVLTPDGRVTAMVWFDYGAEALIRFNADGTEDRSFGDGGDVSLRGGLPRSIAAAPDGKLLVIADGWNDVGDFAIMYRLDAHGDPDPTFGDGGRIVLPADEGWRGWGDFTGAQIVVSEPDGSAIVGLCDVLSPGRGHNYLVRVRPDGSLDPDFGDHGQASITESGSLPIGLLRRPDGRLLVTCSFPYAPVGERDVMIVAFRPDGSRDESFGKNGTFRTPANYTRTHKWDWFEMLPQIAPQGDDGDLILLYGDGGSSNRPADRFFHLARLRETDPAANGPAAAPLALDADGEDADPSADEDDLALFGDASDDFDWEAEDDAIWE